MSKNLIDKVYCKHGIFNILGGDSYIGKSLREYGEWSESEINLYQDLINTNDVVIEIGSHIGSHTIPLANIVKDGQVYAFEPQLLLYKLLNDNLKINSISNTVSYMEAVSNVSQSIKLNEVDYENLNENNKEINSGGIDFKKLLSNESGYNSKVVTIDDKFHKLEKLDFIKIDAEGNEFDILKGGKKLIDKFLPIIYFEYVPQDKEKNIEIFKFLNSFGYISYSHVTPIFNLNNFRKNNINVFSNMVSFMILSIFNKKIDTIVELMLLKNLCKRIKN